MQTLEDGKRREADIAGIEFKPLVAGFLRKHLSQRLATSILRLKQLRECFPSVRPASPGCA